MLALMFLRAACLDGGPNFTFDDSIPARTKILNTFIWFNNAAHTHSQQYKRVLHAFAIR